MRKLSGVLLCSGLLSLGCSSDGSNDPAGGGQAGGNQTGGGQSAGGQNASGGQNTSGGQNASGGGGSPNPNCWKLPAVDRIRLLPAAGKAAALVGAQIEGSNTSPTDGFTDVVEIETAPAEGEWLELTVAKPTAYRFLKFYGSKGNRGDLAELELYAGKEKLTGEAFGTQPDSTETDAAAAFDGDPGTAYRGAVDNDQYVGLDLAAEHVAATPSISPLGGKFDQTTEVTLTSSTPGAKIFYSTNGSDPAKGVEYTGPFKLFRSGTVKAVGTGECLLNSGVAEAVFTIGGTMSPNAQSSFHLGNSLTGPIIAQLPELVSAQKMFTLDFHNCVTAGVDIQNFWADEPPPGCYDLGVNPLKPAAGATEADPKVALQDPSLLPPIDNLVVQPFAAVTCTPYGETGDGAFANNFYQLAKTKNNPNVRLWIYATWSAPTADNWSMVDCFANGFDTWPGSVKLNPVKDWESAMQNHMLFHETVRAEVDKANGIDPSDPRTPGQHAFIVPMGVAMLNLKKEVDAGMVKDIPPGQFFNKMYNDNGQDLHITNAAGYFDACVFYAAFFKASPEGLPGDPSIGVTSDLALTFQRVAWKTVQEYKWAGLN